MPVRVPHKDGQASSRKALAVMETANVHSTSFAAAFLQTPTATRTSRSPERSHPIMTQQPSYTAAMDGVFTVARAGAVDYDLSTTLNTGAVLAATSDAAPTPSTVSPAELHHELPALPHWFIAIVAGGLTFGFVVAIALFLANFPPTFSFFNKLRRRPSRRHGRYHRLHHHDYKDDDPPDDESDGHRRSSVDSDADSYATSTALEESGGGRRRQNTLSIDTSARYAGLGIAVPGDEVLLHRRRSYDEEALQLRRRNPQTPAQAAWQAFTAPLPSARKLVLDWAPPTSRNPNSHTRFQGDGRSPRTTLSSIELFDPASPTYQPSPPMALRLHSVGMFQRLGVSIESAAEKLTRVLNTPVRSAEAGLLLPVKDRDREQYNPSAVCVS